MAKTLKIGDIVGYAVDAEMGYPVRKIRIGCVYASGIMSGRFVDEITGEADGLQVTNLKPSDVIELDA